MTVPPRWSYSGSSSATHSKGLLPRCCGSMCNGRFLAVAADSIRGKHWHFPADSGRYADTGGLGTLPWLAFAGLQRFVGRLYPPPTRPADSFASPSAAQSLAWESPAVAAGYDRPAQPAPGIWLMTGSPTPNLHSSRSHFGVQWSLLMAIPGERSWSGVFGRSGRGEPPAAFRARRSRDRAMQGQRTKSKFRLLHLQGENARLQAEVARWKVKDAQWQSAQEKGQQWRRSLGLKSSNSGELPSSGGPAKPPARHRTRRQRRRSGRRSGGQPGHSTAPDRQAGPNSGALADSLPPVRRGIDADVGRGRFAEAAAGL